jgi:cobalamin synthase
MAPDVRGIDAWDIALAGVATFVLTTTGYIVGSMWPLLMILLPLFGIQLLFDGVVIIVLGMTKRLIWGKSAEKKVVPVQSRGERRIWLVPFYGLTLGGIAGVITWMEWI